MLEPIQPEELMSSSQLLPYRFWHVGWNRMYRVYSIRAGWYEIYDKETNKLITVNAEHGFLMQFTNQTDASGDLVYQGDIIFNRNEGITCVAAKIDADPFLSDEPSRLSEWSVIGDIFTSPSLRP